MMLTGENRRSFPESQGRMSKKMMGIMCLIYILNLNRPRSSVDDFKFELHILVVHPFHHVSDCVERLNTSRAYKCSMTLF